MFVSSLLLSALLSMPTAPADTLRQEQLKEVVVKSNSARQRLRQIQTGAEQVQIKDQFPGAWRYLSPESDTCRYCSSL